LHRRAADWYAEQGLPYDAVHHALRAEDYERVARIALDNVADLWRREELSTLRQWLEAIPTTLRERHPDLCLFYALALFFTQSVEATPPLLELAGPVEARRCTTRRISASCKVSTRPSHGLSITMYRDVDAEVCRWRLRVA
jgi:ATP/maltotriose-dependent transcriptional regulator MalT